jgi:hypothetical protein
VGGFFQIRPSLRCRLLARRVISLQSSASVAFGRERTSNSLQDRLAQSRMTHKRKSPPCRLSSSWSLTERDPSTATAFVGDIGL